MAIVQPCQQTSVAKQKQTPPALLDEHIASRKALGRYLEISTAVRRASIERNARFLEALDERLRQVAGRRAS